MVNIEDKRSVADYTEKPVETEMGTDTARMLHGKAGFASYRGPQLRGPRSVLDAESESYPQQLLTARNPPKKLYVVGNPEALEPGLAIIGARRATPYGLGCVSLFGSIAARKEICLISGGAKGCDSQAHHVALENKAKTVAVLGGGCNHLYPREHHRLFQEIVDAGGAVISENEWDYPPMRHSFRERNRIIAGLSQALLIVEAGYPSGTFSTADEALFASREVMVVPGAITSPTSRGSNHLLCQGAIPIIDRNSFEDALFDVFGVMRQHEEPLLVPGGLGNDPLVLAVTAAPSTREELMGVASRACGKANPAVWLSQRLSQLEVMGVVCRYPNGRYGPVVK